jgi:FHA domain
MSPKNDAGDPTVNLAAIETRLRLAGGGRECLLERGQPALRFGRAADNDLSLGDDFTSRHHATIGCHDGQFQLTDESRNGTLVVFDDGVTCRVHRDRLVLDRQGRLRLGHPTSVAITFVIEIRSTEGGSWLSPARRDANIIRREGDYWTVSYDGRVIRLRDSKGLQYLATLLCEPGREFHALDLVMPASGADTTRVEAGDLGPRLDAAARAAYRDRLHSLREQLAEAEGFHDLGLTTRLRVEIEAIGQQLANAVGLGGRDREAGSDAERARVAVTQRIKHTIEQIRRHDAALGHHLGAAVQTGRFCSYRPDGTVPISWSP